MEVTNRFKGLGLKDTVPEEQWMEVRDTVQEAVIKTIPRKKKCKKAKWLSEEGLQIAEKRREAKGGQEWAFQHKGVREEQQRMFGNCKQLHNHKGFDLGHT